MNLIKALEALDSAIPDALVEAEMREVLRSGAGDDATVRIELGEAEGGYASVPVDARIEIVTKAFSKEYVWTPFGDFRVQVALGGVCVSPEGTLTARLCFATLFYNAKGQRFTIDFHLKVR
jgi:hypothetical protein